MLKALVAANQQPDGVTKLVLPGDFLGGCKFAADHKGESVVDVLNCLGLDYVTLGNHGKRYTIVRRRGAI